MKLKKLEEFLQGVDDFTQPKVALEQYATPPHIAAHMIYNMHAGFGDVDGKLVADLGSGCGMLSIGALLMGAGHVVGFEVDSEAIGTFRTNTQEMDIDAIDVVQLDVVNDLDTQRFAGAFDTVVLNPPFGTKNNAGIDMKFLEAATRLSSNAIYSLHKTTTREFVAKKAAEWNLQGKVVAELRYDLPSSYKFHKKASVDIQVDFWRFDFK